MELKIYKQGQGFYTRFYSAVSIFVVVLIGCYILYERLVSYNIWIQVLVPAGVCTLLGLLTFWVVNIPTVADFMISAEGELKKVSWSSRKEIVASTIAVIIVVVLMSVLLGAMDVGFGYIFMEILKIY